jgi:hypothetical protein
MLYRFQNGQGALSLTILVGGTVILMGITLAFLVGSFAISSGSFRAANRALAIASGGTQDAVLQLIRDRNFFAGEYCVPDDGSGCPAGSLPDGVAKVNMAQDTPLLGQITITGTASSFGSQRKVEVIVSIDQITGRVGVISWKQTIF